MLGNCAVRTAVVASFRGVSWEPSRGPVLQSRSRGEESPLKSLRNISLHVGTHNYNSTNLSIPGSARQTGEED